MGPVATSPLTPTQPGSSRTREDEAFGERLFDPSGLTLEDVILGAWEDLASSGRAECPVCRGRLRVTSCRSCGSELS